MNELLEPQKIGRYDIGVHERQDKLPWFRKMKIYEK